MAEIRYGILSDVHNLDDDSGEVEFALDVLKKQGAQKLILNGDIGISEQGTNLRDAIDESQIYTYGILNAVGKTGLPAVVQPGSHETILGFEPAAYMACKHFQTGLLKKRSRIIPIIKPTRIKQPNHDFVFLPGSDFRAGGEYVLTDSPVFRGRDEIRYSKISDLTNLVRDPAKTIVICHVPRRFNSPNAIDFAYYGQSKDGTVVPGGVIEEEIQRQFGTVNPSKLDKYFKKLGFKRKHKNRGNKALRDTYNALGITKAVSGHFHESGHRAHDTLEVPVPQDTYVDNLFWNTGSLDNGQVGILTVNDAGQAKYQNIDLANYV